MKGEDYTRKFEESEGTLKKLEEELGPVNDGGRGINKIPQAEDVVIYFPQKVGGKN